MNLALILLSIVSCYITILIERQDCEGPYDICKNSSCIGVIANAKNVMFLIEILKENNVESAFVYGWNNHRKVMVLTKDGTLTPFDKNNDSCRHALCIGVCPSKPVVRKRIRKKETPKKVSIETPKTETSQHISTTETASPSCCQTIKNVDVVDVKKSLCCQKGTSNINIEVVKSSCCQSGTIIESVGQSKPTCCKDNKSLNNDDPKNVINNITSCCDKTKTNEVSNMSSLCCQSVNNKTSSICQSKDSCCKSNNLCKGENRKNNSCACTHIEICTHETRHRKTKCKPNFSFTKRDDIICDCEGNEIGKSVSKELQTKTYEITYLKNNTFSIVETDKIFCKIDTTYDLDRNDTVRPYNIPKTIYSPEILYAIQRELNETYNQIVCLYITSSDNLVAIISSKFYYVVCNKDKTEIELVWITEDEYDRLIVEGLHRITFAN